jgi:hypothetical protein
LESDFPETTFQKTNTAKRKNIFLETKSNFYLTGKCFLLTTFLMVNKHMKVWKVISRKVNFGKQTWPRLLFLFLFLWDKTCLINGNFFFLFIHIVYKP